jgi:hypothetical protein
MKYGQKLNLVHEGLSNLPRGILEIVCSYIGIEGIRYSGRYIDIPGDHSVCKITVLDSRMYVLYSIYDKSVIAVYDTDLSNQCTCVLISPGDGFIVDFQISKSSIYIGYMHNIYQIDRYTHELESTFAIDLVDVDKCHLYFSFVVYEDQLFFNSNTGLHVYSKSGQKIRSIENKSHRNYPPHNKMILDLNVVYITNFRAGISAYCLESKKYIYHTNNIKLGDYSYINADGIKETKTVEYNAAIGRVDSLGLVGEHLLVPGKYSDCIYLANKSTCEGITAYLIDHLPLYVAADDENLFIADFKKIYAYDIY